MLCLQLDRLKKMESGGVSQREKLKLMRMEKFYIILVEISKVERLVLQIGTKKRMRKNGVKIGQILQINI